jgi:hypothetical protein
MYDSNQAARRFGLFLDKTSGYPPEQMIFSKSSREYGGALLVKTQLLSNVNFA